MIIGLVGAPSAGKSTFFKAATLAEVEIANYPFTTIKPNTGIAHVRIDCVDKFFNKQCNPRTGYCLNHQRFIPIELLDVAGLVKDAHKGAGMGLQFLDDLRPADVLIHVVDMSGSTNEKGEPVSPGSYDPINDVKFLPFELDMWYFQIIKKGWEKFARQVHQEHMDIARALAKQLSGLGVTDEMAKDSIKKLDFQKAINEWDENNLKALATEFRKITKPMVVAANKMDVPGADKNLERIKKEFPDLLFIPCSAESELALKEANKKNLIKYVPGDSDFEILKDLNDQQKKALDFIKENVLKKLGNTGVQNTLNTAVFDLLKYIAIYPGGVGKLEDKDGNVLPDCFLLPGNSTALDFAYKLHSDFGDNFIRAIDVKTKRTVGKEHKLKHLDVVEIISGK